MLRLTLALLFNLFFFECIAQSKNTYHDYQLPEKISLRGLSVVNDSVAWASGASGTVVYTKDGGKNWKLIKVNGFESSDFRSIYAFDHRRVLIVSIGSPARVLSTEDEGRSWNLVYENSHPEIFLDGIDFWDAKRGVIFGDPIDGRMFLLRTTDGGKSWQEFPSNERPQLVDGEASFAASGTGIRCYAKNKLAVCTGGTKSRIFLSSNSGKNWKGIELPIIQGKPSTGAFSAAFQGKRVIIAGGDYKIDTLKSQHILISTDEGKRWNMPGKPTRGYRECVEFISTSRVIATGPSGTDISEDGGMTWVALNDDKGLHTIRKARSGSLIVMVGIGTVRVVTMP